MLARTWSKGSRLFFIGLLILLGYSYFSVPLPSPLKPFRIYSSPATPSLQKVFLKAIGEAKESIELSTYTFADPLLMTAMEKKAAEGVRVMLYFDARANRKIEGRGIEVIPIRSSGKMHQKYLLIDGKRLFLGSANATRSSEIWYENLVVGLWSDRALDFLHGEEIEIEGRHLSLAALPDEQAVGQLTDLIAGAKRRIDVAMFTFTHPHLCDALLAARKRGVKVRVCLDRNAALGVGKNIKEKLEKGGVKVRVLPSKRLLHHKWMLLDEKVLVMGSTNWTKSAFKKNQDLFMMVDKLNKIEANRIIKINTRYNQRL